VPFLENAHHLTWTQLTLVKEIVSRGFERAKSNGRRGIKGLKLT
jgi:hypothetical protein